MQRPSWRKRQTRAMPGARQTGCCAGWNIMDGLRSRRIRVMYSVSILRSMRSRSLRRWRRSQRAGRSSIRDIFTRSTVLSGVMRISRVLCYCRFWKIRICWSPDWRIWIRVSSIILMNWPSTKQLRKSWMPCSMIILSTLWTRRTTGYWLRIMCRNFVRRSWNDWKVRAGAELISRRRVRILPG